MTMGPRMLMRPSRSWALLHSVAWVIASRCALLNSNDKRNLLREPINLVPHLVDLPGAVNHSLTAIDLTEASEADIQDVIRLKGEQARMHAKLSEARAKLTEAERQQLLSEPVLNDAQREAEELDAADISMGGPAAEIANVPEGPNMQLLVRMLSRRMLRDSKRTKS